MNWKAFGGFLALVVLFCVAVGLLMLVQRPDTLTFVLTGDTQGYLVPCGCRVVPAGGLARRASVLETMRGNKTNGLVVPVEVMHGFADRGPGRAVLNREMGRFFLREHYLVGIGSYDLLLGLKTIRAAAPDVPLYLAGYEGLKGAKAFHLGGWGVGPIGDAGATFRLVFLGESAPGGATLKDPVWALAQEESAHPADGYVVVGQFGPKTASRIIKSSSRVLALVGQWGTEVTTRPQKARKTWVMYLGDRGRRAATLQVTRSGGEWSVLPTITYLGPETHSDPKVEKEVNAVLDRVSQINKAALAKLVEPPVKGRLYMGAAWCARCHKAAHKTWALSGHARATKDLAIDHQTDNPACLKCHATALGQPGGYPQKDVDLAGVQCEACHGPGEGHPGRKLEAVPPSKKTCGTCHDLRDSPMFNAEGFWKLIKHK